MYVDMKQFVIDGLRSMDSIRTLLVNCSSAMLLNYYSVVRRQSGQLYLTAHDGLFHTTGREIEGLAHYNRSFRQGAGSPGRLAVGGVYVPRSYQGKTTNAREEK